MIKIKKNRLKQICFKSSLFVLLVVLCFCSFNLFVNADSLLTTDSYSKMSYFNWDSITISTERGGDSSTGYYPINSIVYGSNDSNGYDIFNDVMMSSYDVEIEEESNYIYVDNTYNNITTRYTFDVGNVTIFEDLSFPFYDLDNNVYLTISSRMGEIVFNTNIDDGIMFNNGAITYEIDNIIYNNVYTSSVQVVSDVPSSLIGYTIKVPANWSATAGYGNFSLICTLKIFYPNDLIFERSLSTSRNPNFLIGYDLDEYENLSNHIACYIDTATEYGFYNTYSFQLYVTGGNDISNPNLINWFANNGAEFIKTSSGGNIQSLSNVIPLATETINYTLTRNVVKNESLSTTTHKCYDVDISSNVPIYQIIFEKNDFYIYSNDLNNSVIPHIMLNLVNQGYNIQYSYDVRFLNKNGSISGGYSTADETELLNYQPLIRNFDSVYATELNENDNVLFYVNSLKVYVSSNQLNTSFSNFKYRYFVESEEYYNEYYKNAKFTFSNIEGVEGLGDSLLQSVNAFMSFELVPGFSLMNILTLLVVIPLLVWILKLFLGG